MESHISNVCTKVYKIIGALRGALNRWFRGQVDCALDYKAGDPGLSPGSGETTDWFFSARHY